MVRAPANRDQHGRLNAGVVQRAQREPGQAEDGTAAQPQPGAGRALQLNLAALDDDERPVPLGGVVGPGAARCQLDHRPGKTRPRRAVEERQRPVVMPRIAPHDSADIRKAENSSVRPGVCRVAPRGNRGRPRPEAREGTRPMAQRDYEEQPEHSDLGASVQLDSSQHLGAPAGDRDGLDAGYATADRPYGLDEEGVTGAGMREGDTFDERLRRELPEEEEYVDADRAGRITIAGEGAALETRDALEGVDEGIDGGAAAAEEAAMHVVEDLDPDSGLDDPDLRP
jgi:hypothetical protein